MRIRARSVSYNFRPGSCLIVLFTSIIYVYYMIASSPLVAAPNTVIITAAAVHVEITAKLQRVYKIIYNIIMPIKTLPRCVLIVAHRVISVMAARARAVYYRLYILYIIIHNSQVSV